MSINDFSDDLAEWDLLGGEGLIADIEAWLERYIKDREANNVATKTVSSYRDAVSSLIQYSTSYDSVIEFDAIGAKFVNNYLISYQNKLAALRDEPELIKEASLNKSGKMGRNDANLVIVKAFESSLLQRTTVIKQMLTFVSQNNKQQHDFTRLFPYIAKIKIHQRPTKYLTSSELDSLIDFLNHWPLSVKEYKRRPVDCAWRDAFIGLLYCYTAARADEVMSLCVNDITEASMMEDGVEHHFYIIQFQNTKGDKYRESAVKKELIRPFVEKIRELLPNNYVISAQFQSGKFINKKMADSTIYRFITMALSELSINKSGRHIIRRGIATNELANGKDIGVVALELGHESPNTTFKHYVKNNKELMMKRALATHKLQ